MGPQVKFLANLLLFLFLFIAGVRAQAQYGRVVTDGALVYQSNDFDSEVLGQLREGQVYRISKNVYGAFYRIALAKKKMGYIADIDIQPISEVEAKATATVTIQPGGGKQVVRKPEPVKRQVGFSSQRWRGLSYAQIQFRENTMGRSLASAKGFFGVKLAGPNLAIEGEIPTEANFYYSSGAPRYYSEAAGRGAGGWIFMADCKVQYLFPQGKNTLTFFGMGPMLRYSKFDVELQGSNSVGYYAMEDILLGASFNLGLSQRFNHISARLEGQYYWEATQYYGIAAAILFAF